MDKEELDFVYEVVYARAVNCGHNDRRAEDLARDAVLRYFQDGGLDE